MKKNLWLIALAFLLASCSNLLNQNSSSSSSESKSNDGNTYLVVDKAAFQRAASSAREAATNLSPTQEDLKVENLKNIKITVKLASGESKTLLEVDAYENLADYKIPVEEGTWDYTLSAMLKDVPYSGTTRKEIKKGLVNTISFKLSSDIHYGKLSLIVSWLNAEENSNANKIIATLKDAEQTKTIATKIIEDEDIIQKSAAIIFDKDSNGSELPGGVYYLSLVFYNEYTVKPLNTTEYYVNIAEGITTKATLKVNLKETFNVIYHDNDGQLKDGEVKTLKFSMLSDEITLPQMTRAGYFWGGWYKNADFSGDPITKITPSTIAATDFNIYAKWKSPVLYVSGTGDDTTGDGTEDKPFETIERACEAIIATDAKYNPQYMDWTIYIMGDVTGKHDSDKKAGERRTGTQVASDYGRSVIPSELTLANAKSILLMGINGLDENDIPKDKINRGLASTSTNYDTGTALGISTEVPVTIKNLLITGGRTATTNGNSDNDTFFTYGGGMHVKAGSTVILDDGTLIEKNTARYGGGVYNAGTLYLIGTACIGDKNATSLAVRGSYDTCSNESTYAGGGLYNVGTLYLGTDEKALTGGIYYNCGLTIWGGGIYNTDNGTVIMKSGNIAYNDGQETCGGIEIVSGSLTMTGGSIHHNSTGGKGGGVLLKPGAIFNFGGGTISANWATGGGGGVFIDSSESSPSIMYMYGTAVIGDKTKTSAPESREGANGTNGNGAGICVNGGRLYMGYKSYTSESDNEPVDLNGGIYYNYCSSTNNDSKGGGIYASGSQGQPKSSDSANAYVRIHSGTIANNYADQGSAICTPNGAHPLVIGGSVKIPSGSEHKHDVFIYSNYNRLFIEDSLEAITADDPIYITLSDAGGTTYNTSYNSSSGLMLAQNATIESLGDVIDKFAVTPLVNKKNGIVTQWTIDPETGKVVQNSSTFYVASVAKNGSDSNTGLASNSPLASITKAIEKINELDNENKDYTIEINGEILGPQTIADTSETEKIKANSIYITGKNTSSANLADIINANLGENETGSALTIDTKVPVTLYYIGITGGHGKEIGSGTDARIAGGGLYIRNNATVSLEGKTHIYENTNFYGSTTVSGAGGGIYVGENAMLHILGSGVEVRENKGTHYGAGIYVADGAYVKISEAAKIKDNSFDEHFKQNGQAVSTLGGGIYLANNATLEMTNGTVSGNTANPTGSTLGRGNGVFVSGTAGSPATFKMGKSACIGIENDIFLQNNVPITIISSLTTYSTVPGIITPENYPSTDSEEITLLTVVPGSSVSISNAASYLKITPQSISGGEKQYWYLNSTGKLAKQTGMGITVTINPGLTNDIAVSVTQNGTAVQDSIHLTAGAPLTFTATEGFASYKWTLDGEEKGTGNTLTLASTDTPSVGSYDLYLEAKDSIGKYYSYTAQIRVSGN